MRTYYTRYFPAGLVILVMAGTAGGILAFGSAPADWVSYLLFGFFLAVLGVVIGGRVDNAKNVVPAARSGRVDVLLSLERGERKQVRRQIAGKAAMDPEHLAVVQLRKGLATHLLLAPVCPLLFIPPSGALCLGYDGVWRQRRAFPERCKTAASG